MFDHCEFVDSAPLTHNWRGPRSLFHAEAFHCGNGELCWAGECMGEKEDQLLLPLPASFAVARLPVTSK